jgi:protein-glutamine gamma-glutamyltransferase
VLIERLSPLWSRSTHLPRETRDVLWVLLVISFTTAPLIGHLELWCSLGLAAVLLGRAWLAVERKPLPSRKVLLGLLAVATAATYWQYRTLLGRDPGVTLIVILLGLKTLEWHHRRDAFVVFFLGFFNLLTGLLFSQSLLMALWMLLAMWGWLMALVLMHRPLGRPGLWEVARTTGAMTLAGMPLVIVLFVLFPRIAPLWSLPGSSDRARSGLSSSMQMGQIAEVVLDDSVALRVTWLESPGGQPVQTPPPKSSLYFRGPVLSVFDGQRWEAEAVLPQARTPLLRVLGKPLHYQVTLEPHGTHHLLTLDGTALAPVLTDLDARFSPQGQWLNRRPVDHLLRYTASSHTAYELDATGAAFNPAIETRLPNGLNPRTSAWAKKLKTEHPQASAIELTRLVLGTLGNGSYRYTLEPGTWGTHVADEFWFDKREGFCEYIAASFVILMRGMDIPARVVTGYQGGELNPVDGVWTLRQSDAHAWAEIWQAGSGWMRIDPTGAVSPDRVGEFQRLLRRPSLMVGAFSTVLSPISPNALQHLRSAWEALNHAWNQKIIGFNQNQQLRLLKGAGWSAPQWNDLIQLLGGGLGVLAIAMALVLRERKPRTDPWLHLLQQGRERMLQSGLTALPANASTQAMLRAVHAQWGNQASDLSQWLHAMQRYRYAAKDTPSLNDLQTRFNQLKWPCPATQSI